MILAFFSVVGALFIGVGVMNLLRARDCYRTGEVNHNPYPFWLPDDSPLQRRYNRSKPAQFWWLFIGRIFGGLVSVLCGLAVIWVVILGFMNAPNH